MEMREVEDENKTKKVTRSRREIKRIRNRKEGKM
jgi:hypothetical protein